MRYRTISAVILAAGLLALFGYSAAQSNRKAGGVKTGTADGFWTTDWDKAMKAAREQKKPVIVDFYTEWCVWCKRLDEDTYAAPEIMKRFKEGWIGVKVNPEDVTKKGTLDGKTVSYAAIARRFKVGGYPTIVFFDKEGKPVDLGFTVNFVPKEPFGPLLDYVKDELYKKNVSLKTYIQDRMKQ